VCQKIPLGFSDIFSQTVGNFQSNFYTLINVPIYAGLQFFVYLSAILTKLCYIKRDYPVHIICSNCPPSAIFPEQLRIFGPNFTHLLHVPICARLLIFITLSPTVMKLCHINHPACVSTDGGRFQHMMVVALNMA